MSDLDPRYEWVEVRALGELEPQYIRGRCLHVDATPVESGGEIVAYLCLVCDAQLPVF